MITKEDLIKNSDTSYIITKMENAEIWQLVNNPKFKGKWLISDFRNILKLNKKISWEHNTLPNDENTFDTFDEALAAYNKSIEPGEPSVEGLAENTDLHKVE